MENSLQNYYSSGFKLSKQLQKKQEELLQSKFNISKSKLPSGPTNDEKIIEADQIQTKNEIKISDVKQPQDFVMQKLNQQTNAPRFTPNLNAASEIQNDRQFSNIKAEFIESNNTMQAIEEPEQNQENSESKESEKVLEQKNLQMKTNNDGQSRIDQFQRNDYKKNFNTNKPKDQQSKVIFGNPGTTVGFRVQDDSDNESEYKGEKNKKITETFVNDNLKDHQLPIELPFHCELQNEVKVVDTDINKFHNVDLGLEYSDSFVNRDNWNLLQIPNENLFGTIQAPAVSEEIAESLEQVNYQDKFALVRHLNSLEYDSCGFIIDKNTRNFDSTKTNDELLKVGKLKVYKSGKMKLCIGNKKYQVASGTNVNFKQSVLALNHNNKRGYAVCNVDKKFISISS